MVTASVEMNHYLLTGNLKNECWLVRNNETLFINDKGRQRRLRYCEGETSIFYDEQNPDSKPTYLAFELGSLLVNQNDNTRNKFLQIHPHFEKRFYLLNEQADAGSGILSFFHPDQLLSRRPCLETYSEFF